MRILSLLPGATEIVCALGGKQQLVGRSHECDYPPSITSLPVCTSSKDFSKLKSGEIDQSVRGLIRNGLSIYELEPDTIRELNPDLIITQEQCEVCAVSYSKVEAAVSEHLDEDTTIFNMAPADLDSLFEDIRSLAREISRKDAGRNLVASMKHQMTSITDSLPDSRSLNVLSLEWIDPLMHAGNWIPELYEYVQVHCLKGKAGSHSETFSWEQFVEMNPESICIAPCGYPIDRTLDEMNTLTGRPEWEELKAVQSQEVYILDGKQYFNRPGPRLADSVHILYEIFHGAREEAIFHNKGWVNFLKDR